MWLLYRASKVLGCPMWELADKPFFWLNFALEMEAADIWARQELEKRRPTMPNIKM